MSSRTDPRLPETPLRVWRKSSGKSYAQLAREVGCSIRTIKRIASGAPATDRVATALEQATGLTASVFKPPPWMKTGRDERGRFKTIYVEQERVERLSKLDRLLERVAEFDRVRDAILGEVAKEVG